MEEKEYLKKKTSLFYAKFDIKPLKHGSGS
jgi:hypothetical protein